MKKRIFVLCLVAVLAFSMFSAAAASGGNNVVQPKTAYGSFALAAFASKMLYAAGNQPFKMVAGQTMTVTLSLTTTASVGIGYIHNGQTVIDRVCTGQNISHNMVMPSNGNYVVVIQNATASGIYVNSCQVL